MQRPLSTHFKHGGNPQSAGPMRQQEDCDHAAPAAVDDEAVVAEAPLGGRVLLVLR